LIIASGTENTKLNVAGEEQYNGIGISYCATCDGKLTAGKNTIVIGNDIEAITSAIYLAPIAKKVTLI
jgi:thioredoxin reductase (NADPH)